MGVASARKETTGFARDGMSIHMPSRPPARDMVDTRETTGDVKRLVEVCRCRWDQSDPISKHGESCCERQRFEAAE